MAGEVVPYVLAY